MIQKKEILSAEVFIKKEEFIVLLIVCPPKLFPALQSKLQRTPENLKDAEEIFNNANIGVSGFSISHKSRPDYGGSSSFNC